MANQVSTNLKTAELKLQGKFASNEMRGISASTYKMLLDFTPAMNISDVRTREDRVVELSYQVQYKATAGTARSHDHTGPRGDTGVVTPSWNTSTSAFSISLKQNDNNTYDAQETLNNNFASSYINILRALESSAQDFIYDNRTGVDNSTGGGGTFNGTDKVYDFTTANIDTVIQKTKTVMEENDYTGEIVIAADSQAYDLFRFQAAQGTGNDTNLSFQFDGIKFIRSINLAAKFAPLAGVYTKGVWIAYEEGSVGALPWIPKQNREGIVTQKNTYSAGISPYDGVPYGVHYYETLADTSGVNGATQDVVTQVQVSIDMAYVVSPISTANESALFAFSIQA